MNGSVIIGDRWWTVTPMAEMDLPSKSPRSEVARPWASAPLTALELVAGAAAWLLPAAAVALGAAPVPPPRGEADGGAAVAAAALGAVLVAGGGGSAILGSSFLAGGMIFSGSFF